MRRKTWHWPLGLCLSVAATGCVAAGPFAKRIRKNFAVAEQPDTKMEHMRRSSCHE